MPILNLQQVHPGQSWECDFFAESYSVSGRVVNMIVAQQGFLSVHGGESATSLSEKC